jgi:hypothetical protein
MMQSHLKFRRRINSTCIHLVAQSNYSDFQCPFFQIYETKISTLSRKHLILFWFFDSQLKSIVLQYLFMKFTFMLSVSVLHGSSSYDKKRETIALLFCRVIPYLCFRIPNGIRPFGNSGMVNLIQFKNLLHNLHFVYINSSTIHNLHKACKTE